MHNVYQNYDSVKTKGANCYKHKRAGSALSFIFPLLVAAVGAVSSFGIMGPVVMREAQLLTEATTPAATVSEGITEQQGIALFLAVLSLISIGISVNALRMFLDALPRWEPCCVTEYQAIKQYLEA